MDQHPLADCRRTTEGEGGQGDSRLGRSYVEVQPPRGLVPLRSAFSIVHREGLLIKRLLVWSLSLSAEHLELGRLPLFEC